MEKWVLLDVLLVHSLRLVMLSSSHTNFRMEKFDEHQNLRLLWPVFPARPTRQKPHLPFSTGLSERTTQAVATNQNEDGSRLP
jgi:hypothetical protein